MGEEGPSSTRDALVDRVRDVGVEIDRLFVALTELPYAEGDAAAVQAMVDAVAAILPGHAVGACLVGAAVPIEDLMTAGRAVEQRVFQRVPAHTDAGAARALGIDPTRLFPGYGFERVFEVGNGAAGSTLHLATDDPSLEDDGSPAAHVGIRTASALGHVLTQARAHTAAHRARSELRALESQVMQADKLASFGQIAAGLVHELNNPLTSIVAYTDYLIKKALVQGDAVEKDDMERLRRIGESANRMLRFTRDLVSYARPSSEVAVPVVLHGVIDRALAFCEHVLAEAGATVDRRYGVGVLTVRGMPEQLTQVFVNLVTNACHAVAAKGGCIVVETCLVDTRVDARTYPRAGEGRIRVVVRDDGHGIAVENLPHVFAPFFTTKREGRGTGLGLSIVRNIVHAHGGTIRAESGPDAGSVFTIELPVGR
jgi:C4-dicarboxylate-specific signal transduction histidine kinase